MLMYGAGPRSCVGYDMVRTMITVREGMQNCSAKTCVAKIYGLRNILAFSFNGIVFQIRLMCLLMLIDFWKWGKGEWQQWQCAGLIYFGGGGLGWKDVFVASKNILGQGVCYN